MGKPIDGIASVPRWRNGNRALLFVALVLCVVGAFLRLYRLDDLMGFDGDQGRDITAIQRMVETGQPALLGPGSGVGQFKRGPAYYYLLLPAVWLSGGDPLGGMYFIALVNIAAIGLVYVVGRALVSPAAGLVSSALFAVGLVPVVVSRAYTNPALLPCLTLVMVYALWRMVAGDDRFLLVLVGAWVIAWQLHDQVWLLLPFFAAAWIWFKIRVRGRMIALALALVLALLAPFIVYETTHDAANTRLMLDYVRSAGAERAGEVGVAGAPRRVVETLWVLARAFAVPAALRAVWSAALAASAVLLVLRFRKESSGAQVLGLYAFVPLLFALWPGPIYEVNVAIAIPLPFLLCGYGFDRLIQWQPRWRQIGAVFVALLCVINLYLQFDSLRTRSLGANSYLTTRMAVAEILARTAGQPFVLEYIVQTRNEEFASPLQYLLKRYRANVTTDPLAMRVRVYNPAELGGNGEGTLIYGIRVVALSVPQPTGENLLVKPWNLPAQADRASPPESADQDSLRLDAVSQTQTAVQRVPIEQNALYLLQFECKNELRRGEQRLFVSALDTQSNTIETYPNGAGYLCPPSAEWSQGAVLFQAPERAVRARVLLQNQGEGAVWFRNIRLQRAIQMPLP